MSEDRDSYRADNWRQVLEALTGWRERVYQAFLSKGPCTTMELAGESGISPFVVRPRATELLQLGLLDRVGTRKHAHKSEGVFQAVALREAMRRRVAARGRPTQMELF